MGVMRDMIRILWFWECRYIYFKLVPFIFCELELLLGDHQNLRLVELGWHSLRTSQIILEHTTLLCVDGDISVTQLIRERFDIVI